MATITSTGSAGGVNAILPLAEERDKVKKKLDRELTDIVVSSTPSKDYWEIVHCKVCTTDFLKGELTSPTGSGLQACPQCKGNTLKPGKFVRSPYKTSCAF